VTTPPDHPARILEHAFWRAVEEIGQCIGTSIERLSDDQLAAYALGVEHTLGGMLEHLHELWRAADDPSRALDGMSWSNQLRGAVGEQLRRRHPGDRCCAGRKLNELLGTIRDWRIAIVAGDDSMFDGPWLHQAVTRLEHEFRQWRTSFILICICSPRRNWTRSCKTARMRPRAASFSSSINVEHS
jgi:hypothetical protein